MFSSVYRFEVMRNGLVHVQQRGSGLRGLYSFDGAYHSGDLRRVPSYLVRDAVLEAK